MSGAALAMPQNEVEQFCQRNHIRKLSLFCSTSSPWNRNLPKNSGARSNLRTPGDLSRYFRDQVVATSCNSLLQNWLWFFKLENQKENRGKTV